MDGFGFVARTRTDPSLRDTPAILVTAKALLDHNPHPDRNQIREALSGNLCRCTGYLQIFEAVEAAILKIAEQNRELSAAQGSGNGSPRV